MLLASLAFDVGSIGRAVRNDLDRVSQVGISKSVERFWGELGFHWFGGLGDASTRNLLNSA